MNGFDLFFFERERHHFLKQRAVAQKQRVGGGQVCKRNEKARNRTMKQRDAAEALPDELTPAAAASTMENSDTLS